ncbi:hypothetical protein CN889_28165 [Bacillus wiedmannii]|nr:hypothetical protein CN889_28165 [Bacillus wiedmannii]
MTERKTVTNAVTEIYNPKDADGNFYRIHQDLDFYQYVDGYKAEMSYLFGIIANYYNPERGYAYPTQYQLMKRYNKSINVLRSHINKLVEVGLISKLKGQVGNNHCYVPHYPLSKDELFKKMPKAEENYKKRMKWVDKRATRDANNLDKLNKHIAEEIARRKAEEEASSKGERQSTNTTEESALEIQQVKELAEVGDF